MLVQLIAAAIDTNDKTKTSLGQHTICHGWQIGMDSVE